MRRFYDAFVIPQTVPAELAIGSALLAPKGENADNERIALDFEQHTHLGWSHYILLLREKDFRRLRFYFEQAATQHWSVRQLNRQTDAALYERVALSKNRPRVPLLRSEPRSAA